jgi:hypothetical protein
MQSPETERLRAALRPYCTALTEEELDAATERLLAYLDSTARRWVSIVADPDKLAVFEALTESRGGAKVEAAPVEGLH